MRLGVHCSVRNGFSSALGEAVRLGCETLQMFTQNPRGWKTRLYAEEEFSSFRNLRDRSRLTPIVVHSPYLPNLCTSDSRLYKRSVETLKDDLRRSEMLAADFLVIHPGAYSPNSDVAFGLRQIHQALNEAIDAVPGRCRILIENMAGGGRRLGGPFSEVADILNGVKNQERMGVCFDTCHAAGAGYDLSSPESVEGALQEFDRLVGLNRIAVFHVNDSRGAVGSHRDLHEHLGKGTVGLAGFRAIFHRTVFKDCALILETPKDSPRADLKNLKTLRGCLIKD